jgi:hypothetical protein
MQPYPSAVSKVVSIRETYIALIPPVVSPRGTVNSQSIAARIGDCPLKQCRTRQCWTRTIPE